MRQILYNIDHGLHFLSVFLVQTGLDNPEMSLKISFYVNAKILKKHQHILNCILEEGARIENVLNILNVFFRPTPSLEKREICFRSVLQLREEAITHRGIVFVRS